MNVAVEDRNDGAAQTDTVTCPPGNPSPVILRATGLKRSFGKVAAVEGVDLTVREGEIYGFLGVNGAGKTTTIRMLMGIIKPEAGLIELQGQQTRRTSIQQKQGIGYVSQEQTFYPWMTAKALGRFVGGLYPTWDAAEFERLLRVLDVPNGRKASQMSGGTRVKLALALALAPHPAILILDEPTSGLDPVARREFLEIIKQQARDHHRTTFFSSHIVGEIERVADRVGIIHRGRMCYEGDLETLRTTVRMVRVPVVETPRKAIPPADSDLAPPLLPEAANATEAPPLQAPLPAMIPTAFVPGEGFEVLREEVHSGMRELLLRASPSAWAGLNQAGIEICNLSLEDIFIGLVRTRSATI